MVNLAQQEFRPTVMVKGDGLYRLPQDVILIFQDGVARLLDLNRGRFYGLDSVGTKTLMLLLEHGLETVVSCVAQDYGVAEELVRTDLTKLLQELECKKLLISQLSQSQEFPKLPSRLTIYVLLTLAWISVRILGWTKTIRLWRRLQCPVDKYTLSDDWEPIVQAVNALICKATATHLFLPMACKERALVGWHILKSTFGLPAELVIGINLYPFQAHAWVECGSWIVTDERSHCEIFTPAIRYN